MVTHRFTDHENRARIPAVKGFRCCAQLPAQMIGEHTRRDMVQGLTRKRLHTSAYGYHRRVGAEIFTDLGALLFAGGSALDLPQNPSAPSPCQGFARSEKRVNWLSKASSTVPIGP